MEHNIVISKYNFLAGNSYLKLPKELDHLRKVFISLQNIDDNECFQWGLVKITKADHEFPKKLDFKDIKFPVKFRVVCKIEEKKSSRISDFDYENKEKIEFLYQKMLRRKTC